MSSPITFSGFNSIDFSVVLNSMMAAASQPLTALQTRQSAIQSQVTNMATLTSKVSAVQTAAAALSSATALASYSATSTDSTAVSVTPGAGAATGHYDVVVKELARAQVTASTSSAPDATTTAVATGGSVTINGKVITVSQPATLQQLADAINSEADIGVTASIVQSAASEFRLVLTANSSGLAAGFSITNNTLTGGPPVDPITHVGGDVAFGINAVNPSDAWVTVNNIDIHSASNTLTGAIPGATFTVAKKDLATTIGVDIAEDTSALRTRLNTFVSAYNAFSAFANAQTISAGNGDATSIGRDPILRQLRNQLRSQLTSQSGTSDTSYLSRVGVEFTQAGTLQVNNSVFQTAAAGGAAALASLFAGTTGSPGAFASINTLLTTYTQSNGMLSNESTQLATQVTHLQDQIGKMSDRLALQRTSLQAQFTAADAAMTALKSQSGSLSAFGASAPATAPSSSAS